MKALKRTLALFLALATVFALTACSGSEDASTKPGNTPADPAPLNEPHLVVAYSAFSGRFSPFYADTAYDQDVAGLVGLGLMTTDRMGGIIWNAIEGETVNYNGTDYHYTGPADLKVEYDADTDQTVYTAKLREDLKFSDGEPVTAKDILFTYYTYLDPAYVGSSGLPSYDIVGLEAWRTEGANSIEGIKMIDDYTVSVTVNGYSAPAVYSILGITITPMHYYGNVNKWDPDNGMYGFERSDLNRLRSTVGAPLGAGPYVFESYQDKVVTFKANPNYYKGEPKIKTVLFRETNANEVAAAVKNGDADCGEMTGPRTRFEE
ncbi:MAG: hypothetical protein J5789_05485, partial [Oscillospiraceae bacterium]|nr:hypothetical protein [Oscillospiraceae bacterium]